MLLLGNFVQGEPLNPKAVAKAGAIIAEGANPITISINIERYLSIMSNVYQYLQNILSSSKGPLTTWLTCSVAVVAGSLIIAMKNLMRIFATVAIVIRSDIDAFKICMLRGKIDFTNSSYTW